MQRLISVGGRTMEQSKPKGGFPVVLLISEPVMGRPGSAASKVFAWHASHNSSLGGISLYMVIVGGGFVVADLIRIYTGG